MAKIVSINNALHEVTISVNGDRHSFTIPEEHRVLQELREAYIKKEIEAFDALDRTVKPIEIEVEKIVLKVPKVVYAIMAIEAAMIVGLLIKVF